MAADSAQDGADDTNRPHPIPETHVLAVASHVVYGNVGNTMAAQALRFMGCDVAALNTVHFSNHTGYSHVRGTKASAEDIAAVYAGLKANKLTDFDVMLSGYAPGAAAVQAVGDIARDLRTTRPEPGSFFWALDPVMGDEGKLYVNVDVVPAYKAEMRAADLILPNQFELELLTDTSITSFATLTTALARLHAEHGVPHIVVTSVRLPDHASSASRTLAVVGSSRTAAGAPRAFRIDVPDLDCYFSGTGDLFAALLVARLREAVADVPGLSRTASWLPDDSTGALTLPLCTAVARVLASMARVLERTKVDRDAVLGGDAKKQAADEEQRDYWTRAAEIRIVRHAKWLLEPRLEFEAVAL